MEKSCFWLPTTVLFFSGAGSSITGVASLCLCADLVGTDTENGAFVYSVVTAMDKLLGGVVVIIIEYTYVTHLLSMYTSVFHLKHVPYIKFSFQENWNFYV